MEWVEYIKECISPDLWGFVLLDYFYKKKEIEGNEDPSQFIDRVISELPKEGIDFVAFHNTLLSVCVHLLGNSFSDIISKSVNFVDEVKGDVSDHQMEKIRSQYDTYGKRELFMEKLKASKVKIRETDVEDTKQEQVMKKSITNPITNATKRTGKVFISYSSVDEAKAKKVAHILSKVSVSYFLDCKDISWGEDVYEVIKDSLAGCASLIVIISPASVKSQWVALEVGQAIALGKKVLPFLTHPSIDLPDFLKGLHFKTRISEITEYFRNEYSEMTTLAPLLKKKSINTATNKTDTPIQDTKQKQSVTIDKDTSFDIGIVIALKEEFREFYSELKEFEYDIDKSLGYISYLFEHPCKDQASYRCVAAFVGDKGEKKAALLTTHIINKWDPKTIVVLGIGGGIDKDVSVGDVVVAKQIDSYIDDSKVTPEKRSSGFRFCLGGTVYQASSDLIKFVQNFEFIKNKLFQDWLQKCSNKIRANLDQNDFDKLVDNQILCVEPKLLEGDIASGPSVGAAKAFTKWLKDRNRNYYVLDMESGGVLTAIYERINPKKTLILRGISDYGDERKKKLDKIKKGVLRKYAMHNAIELLWCLLEAQALPHA